MTARKSSIFPQYKAPSISTAYTISNPSPQFPRSELPPPASSLIPTPKQTVQRQKVELPFGGTIRKPRFPRDSVDHRRFFLPPQWRLRDRLQLGDGIFSAAAVSSIPCLDLSSSQSPRNIILFSGKLVAVQDCPGAYFCIRCSRPIWII